MIVRVHRVRPRCRERKVTWALRVVTAKHPLGGRAQLVFALAGGGFPHRFHDAEPGDPRHLPHHRDLSRALDEAHRVDDRIEVLDLDLRRRGPQLLCERGLARWPTVPRVGGRRPRMSRRFPARAAASHLGTEGRKDDTFVLPHLGNSGGKGVALHHRFDSGEAGRHVARTKLRPVVALAPRRSEIERRALRLSVDDQNRAGHLDAGEIEELVILPERHLGRHLGSALQNRDRIADLFHHAGTPSGKLLGRKDVREVRERLLRRQHRSEQETRNGELLHGCLR